MSEKHAAYPIDILFVGEDPVEAIMVKEMLTEVEMLDQNKHAFQLTHVGQLAESLAYLDTADPDLLILDLSLTDQQSLEWFKRFQGNSPGLPIILLTKDFDEMTAIEAVQRGAQDCLVNGQIDGKLLGRAIRYAIERQRAQLKLKASEARLTSILELSIELAIIREEGLLLDTLVNRTAALARSPMCSVLLADEACEEAILVAQTGLVESTAMGLRVPLTASKIQHSMRTAEPLVVTDINRYAPELWGGLIRDDIQTFYAYPIIRAEHVFGFLTFGSLEVNKPAKSEVTAYQLLAERAAAALEAVRLFAISLRQTEELELLRQASLQLTSNLDLQDVLKAILSYSIHIAGAANAQIFFYNNQKLELGAILWADGESHDVTFKPRKSGLTETVAQSGERMIISDINSEPLYEDWQWGGAIIGFPLKLGGRVLGVVNIAFKEPRTFEEYELRFLDLLAAQAATALDNSRLFNETERRAGEMETMVKVSSALRTVQTKDEILPIILDETFSIFKAQGVALLTYHSADKAETVVEMARGSCLEAIGMHLPLGQGIPKEYFFQGGPGLNIPGPEEQQALWPKRLGEFRLVAFVSLTTMEESFGVLGICREDDLTQREIQLLTALADVMTNAIQRANLFEQTLMDAAELKNRVAEQTSELRMANAELSRAVRVKDEFLANMSHELRTPLNNILVRSEILQEGLHGTLNEKQTRSIQIIDESGRHLLNIINDILDVAKSTAGKLEFKIESVSAESVCQASLQFVKLVAQQKRISLSTNVQPTTLWVDGRRLKQILVNLLDNAVKFTEAGGQAGLHVVTDSQNKKIHFTVWDTGMGISTEDQARLFEPFFQLSGGLAREHEGTGLGLVLVRRLAALHDGSVSVESEVGKGSRFTVSFPWQPDVRPGWNDRRERVVIKENPVKQEQPISEAARPPTLLLAEDNEDLINALTEYLTGLGYSVEVARNGIEALKQAGDVKPDLILMDIHLPVMDGLEAIRGIRASVETETIPIIALTAMGMAEDEAICFEAGATAFMSKPVRLSDLAKVIETLLVGGSENEAIS